MKSSGIAVIGVAARMPGCENYTELEQALKRADKHTNTNITGQRQEDIEQIFPSFKAAPMSYLERVDLFDNDFFGISKGEANRMRPEQRLMLEETVNCIHDAGYSLNELRGTSTGIFTSKVDSQFKLLFNQLSKSSMAELSQSMDATRVAYTLDLRGPSIIIDTTCSSSLVALHTACQNIKDGTCDQALVGGVSLWVIPEASVDSSPILSKKRDCSAFDDSADGTLFGEGALMVLLKSEEQALKDGDHIHAVIQATHVNHGGAQIANITAPSPESQSTTIGKTWEKAGVHPKQVGYLETHGTGTVLGDPIEVKGILSAIKKSGETENVSISLGALKSQFGHLDGASGLAGLIKLILLGKCKTIPKLVNFDRLNSNIPSSSVLNFPKEQQTWPEEKPFGGVSSFGVSGTNAHALIRTVSDQRQYSTREKPLYVIVVKAKSELLLEKQMKNLETALAKVSEEALLDFCITFNHLKLQGEQQRVITGYSKEELLTALNRTAKDTEFGAIDCFIGNNSDINVDAFQNLLQYSEELGNKYTAILSGFSATGGEAERFARLASFLEWLTALGVKFERFIVNGFGELVSEYVQGNMDLSAVEQKVNNTFEALSKDKFTNFVNTYKNASKQIFHLGNSGEILDIVLSELGSENATLCRTNFLELIKNVLQSCAWNHANLLYGKPKNRIPINVNFFDRKRCWPKMESPVVAPKEVDASGHAPEAEAVEVNEASVSEFIKATWCYILDIEEIKDTDDFFDLGGTSLMGLDVVDALQLKFNVSLAYEDVFDFPVLNALTEKVVSEFNAKNEEKKEVPTQTNFSEEKRKNEYEKLRNETKGKSFKTISLNTVLLTGSTGYLGVYLLNQLLEGSNAEIYCVVRAESEQAGWAKLSEHYHHYFNNELPKDRVKIVIADLFKDELPKISNLDAIYHSAALVNHYGKYDVSYEANTAVTRKLVDWALDNKARNFFHMSTSAVAGASINGTDEYAYFEMDGNIGQEFNGNIYPETKFLAEEYIRSVSGINYKLFRIANISGNSKTGTFQSNSGENSSLMFLKDLVKINAYPESLLAGSTNLNPVDCVAKAVVTLSKLDDLPVNHFHINDQEVITFQEVIHAIKRQGVQMREISDANFNELLSEKFENSSRTLPMIGILKNRRKHSHALIHFETQLTNQILNQQGWQWDYDKQFFLDQFIQKYIGHETVSVQAESTH